MDTDGHKVTLSRRRPTIEKLGIDVSSTTPSHSSRLECSRHPLQKQNTHFHYDQVEFDRIEASLQDDTGEDEMYNIRVAVNGRSWIIRRSYEQFNSLDSQIHLCTFSRISSNLIDLEEFTPDSVEEMNRAVAAYLDQFTHLCTGHPLYCGSILSFFEIDGKGQRLMGTEETSAINIPAIAAARTIRSYTSQASDELNLEVGDMLSVIDKPEPHESSWWRGKKKFEVGFFPSECVELIGGDHSRSPACSADTKPVLSGRGKLIAFLRMFFSNRPNRSTLKQEGIVKERVFGCDLAEHLTNTSQAVPLVLTSCCEAIEQHGQVNGIYRLTGVASNIQQLRAAFDEGHAVDLSEDRYRQDIHTITAVLKMYFRELPNPLLTYQLYDSFSEAVELTGENRINKIKNCIKSLPPPHYRTAKCLFSHIHRMTEHSSETGMDSKNLAIVWSPNLMRSKVVEAGNVTGAEMLHSVSIQATLVEALISSYDTIFTEEDASRPVDVNVKSRPNSVAGNAANRLITLSEAQSRVSSDEERLRRDTNSYIQDTGDVLPVFHTVIDFNTHSDRKSDLRTRSSQSVHGRHSDPSGSHLHSKDAPKWKSFFHRPKASSTKSHRHKHSLNSMGKSFQDRDDITENEIGHLSRKVQASRSTSNLTNRVLIEGDSISLSGQSDDGRLQRAASHESFFDVSAQTSPLPQSNTLPSAPTHSSPNPLAAAVSLTSVSREVATYKPAITLLPSTDEFKAPLTPGVVFRPAYTKAANELLVSPKVTWKQSMTHVAEEYNPHSNVSTMHRSTQHIPQFLPALPGRCPGEREQFSPVPPSHNSPQFVQEEEEEENPYEEVIPRSPTLVARNQISPAKAAVPLTEQTSNSNPPSGSLPKQLNVRTGGLVYAPVGPSRLALSVSPPQHSLNNGTEQHPPSHTQQSISEVRAPPIRPTILASVPAAQGPVREESSAEQFSLNRFVQDSDTPEMRQCVNQAVQARLSRSYSTNESDRPSRAASRRTYDSPTYANLSATVPASDSSEVRQAAMPVRTKHSNVDQAMAASNLSSTGQYNHRPTRIMDSGNRKGYEPGSKVLVRQASMDSASLDSSSSMLVRQADPPSLSSSWSHAPVQQSESSSTATVVTQPPAVRQRKMTPPSPAPRKISLESSFHAAADAAVVVGPPVAPKPAQRLHSISGSSSKPQPRDTLENGFLPDPT